MRLPPRKLMKHHDEPNCSDEHPLYTVANGTVRPGEELTCNYLEFDEDSKRAGLLWLSFNPG